MQIHINNLNIRENSSGVKTYQINLIRELLHTDSKSSYRLICSKSNRHLFHSFTSYRNCKIVTVPIKAHSPILRIILDQLLVPLLCLRRKSILISSQNVCSIFAICKQVLIIQGPLAISSIRKEANFNDLSLFNKIYYFCLFKISLIKADRIIAVSHYLKKHIALIAKEKEITVIHEGVTKSLFDHDRLKNKSNRHTNEVDYILFVSTLFKYKGIEELLYAYSMMSSQHKKRYQLWVIGKDPYEGKYLEQLQKMAAQLGISNNVLFKGKIPHGEIVDYYHNAHLFIYPSFIESFGLPPLEAMSSGVPVISSNKMSIPEIVGDAAVLIDPKDMLAFSEAIMTVLDNADLQEELIQKGYENIGKFSWVTMAEKIFEILKRL